MRHHTGLMDAARRELRGSADFKLLLQHVLAVGTRMNMGTAKGAAQVPGPYWCTNQHGHRRMGAPAVVRALASA